MVSSFTGDFNASAPAVTAAQAMVAKGVQVIYPYLGGATDAVANVANTAHIATITPGFNGCGNASPSFAISGLFSPGLYLSVGLAKFAAGTMRTGVIERRYVGRIYPYPTAKICKPTGNEATLLKALIQKVASGKVDIAAAYKKTHYTP